MAGEKRKAFKEEGHEDFLKRLANISKEEVAYLCDFDKRMGYLWQHRKFVNKLALKSEKLRALGGWESKESKELVKEINKIADSLINGIRRAFDSLIYDVRLEKEDLMKEKGVIVEFHDAETLLKDFKGGGQVKAKVVFIIQKMEKQMEIEKVSYSLIQHLEMLLGNLNSFIERQKQYLEIELEILNDYLNLTSKNIKPKVMASAEKHLRDTIREIEHLLREEKEKAIDPFGKFLKKKSSYRSRIKELKKSDLIGWNQIAADLRTFTNLGEANRYLKEIYNLIIEDPSAFRGSIIRRSKSEKDWLEVNKKFIERIHESSINVAENYVVQATKDALMNIPNRGMFDKALSDLMYTNINSIHSNKGHFAFSLLLIDIDRFKLFNDLYGHDAGDVVLKGVAKILQQSLRGSDTLYRYGGEELAVILPTSTKVGALNAAQRLRNDVMNESKKLMRDEVNKNFQIKEKMSRIFYNERSKNGAPGKEMQAKGVVKELRRITISIGVASFPDDLRYIDVTAATPEAAMGDMIKASDWALYVAKEKGRNQVWDAAARPGKKIEEYS